MSKKNKKVIEALENLNQTLMSVEGALHRFVEISEREPKPINIRAESRTDLDNNYNSIDLKSWPFNSLSRSEILTPTPPYHSPDPQGYKPDDRGIRGDVGSCGYGGGPLGATGPLAVAGDEDTVDGLTPTLDEIERTANQKNLYPSAGFINRGATTRDIPDCTKTPGGPYNEEAPRHYKVTGGPVPASGSVAGTKPGSIFDPDPTKDRTYSHPDPGKIPDYQLADINSEDFHVNDPPRPIAHPDPDNGNTFG